MHGAGGSHHFGMLNRTGCDICMHAAYIQDRYLIDNNTLKLNILLKRT